MTSFSPVHTSARRSSRPCASTMTVSPKEARRRGIEALRSVGIPKPERRIDEYSFELSGGLAPAGDDRGRAFVRPAPAHRRRADDGARRDHAGADPRPAAARSSGNAAWRSCSSRTTWASSPRWPTTWSSCTWAGWSSKARSTTSSTTRSIPIRRRCCNRSPASTSAPRVEAADHQRLDPASVQPAAGLPLPSALRFLHARPLRQRRARAAAASAKGEQVSCFLYEQ